MLTRLHAYMLTAIALILYTALMIALIIRAMRRFYGGYSCSIGHTREHSLRRSTDMLMEYWSGRWNMHVRLCFYTRSATHLVVIYFLNSVSA